MPRHDCHTLRRLLPPHQYASSPGQDPAKRTRRTRPPKNQHLFKMSKNPATIPLPSGSNTRPFQFLQLQPAPRPDFVPTTCPAPAAINQKLVTKDSWREEIPHARVPFAFGHQPKTINHQPTFSLRKASHKGPVRIYVTLHDLHDSNGNVPQMRDRFPAAAPDGGASVPASLLHLFSPSAI
jgi:hypothetical protein